MMKVSIYIIALMVCMIGAGSFAEVEAATARDLVAKTTSHEGSRMISEKIFRNIFSTYLHQNLGKEESDIVLSRFKVTHNRPIPEGDVKFQLFQKNKSSLKGYVRLVAIVKVAGVAQNEVKLSGWVDVFSPVVCTTRNLKRGEILKDDDIYLGRKNISRLPATILEDKDKALGLMAKHSIKQGTSLKEWMLERSPILTKGDLVTILAELGSVKIAVPGRIMEKGYPGELIRVRNAMSSKEIHARVIDNSTVTVDF